MKKCNNFALRATLPQHAERLKRKAALPHLKLSSRQHLHCRAVDFSSFAK
jgi:hypothetical protein